MALVPLKVLIDKTSDQTQTILVPEQSIVFIAPLSGPVSDTPSDGVIAYDQLDENGKPKPFFKPDDEDRIERTVITDYGVYQADKDGKRIDPILPEGRPETYEEFYARTRHPSARSFLRTQQATGNGYTWQQYQLPETVDEILANLPENLKSSAQYVPNVEAPRPQQTPEESRHNSLA